MARKGLFSSQKEDARANKTQVYIGAGSPSPGYRTSITKGIEKRHSKKGGFRQVPACVVYDDLYIHPPWVSKLPAGLDPVVKWTGNIAHS